METNSKEVCSLFNTKYSEQPITRSRKLIKFWSSFSIVSLILGLTGVKNQIKKEIVQVTYGIGSEQNNNAVIAVHISLSKFYFLEKRRNFLL